MEALCSSWGSFKRRAKRTWLVQFRNYLLNSALDFASSQRLLPARVHPDLSWATIRLQVCLFRPDHH